MRDARTGLLWTTRDAGVELAWPTAEQYCRERAGGGGEPAWRLPSSEELLALYDATVEQPCGGMVCRIDAAIDLTGPWVWSSTARGDKRRVYVDFQHGSQLAPRLRPGLKRRALCTRRATTP